MKRLFASLISVISLGAMAANLVIDTAHSDLGFQVRHLVVAKVKGRFDKWNGAFDMDEKTGAISNLKIEVETESVNTNNGDRDKHLKSDDFFKVASNPKATFEAKNFTVKKGKPTKVDGTLTLLGVTKPIKLDVNYLGSITDPWGNAKSAFEVKGKIKRSDYGMTWNKKLDKGGVMLSDDVELEVTAEAAPKPAEKK